jgi:quercetin dioxygenase-like cupin family protein
MKLIKHGQGVQYEAPGHFNCYAMNKLGVGQDTKRLAIGMSHFLPGGGAQMSSSAKERAYYVLSGTLKITGKNEEYEINPGDLIYIGAGEERAFQAMGTEPATILVIIVDV